MIHDKNGDVMNANPMKNAGNDENGGRNEIRRGQLALAPESTAHQAEYFSKAQDNLRLTLHTLETVSEF